MSQFVLFFSLNDTPTTEIYTLSLHDALPISAGGHAPAQVRHRYRLDVRSRAGDDPRQVRPHAGEDRTVAGDRKSTRLNSSHVEISYAVFCLKKKIQNATSSTTLETPMLLISA